MKGKSLLKDICVLLAAAVAVTIVLSANRTLRRLTSGELSAQNQTENLYYTMPPEERPLPAETTQAVTFPEETSPPETMPPETTVAQTLPEETIPVQTTAATTAPEETEPPRQRIDEIPLYDQTDYPDELYGEGTIGEHGSSITALAMVASYLTDHPYLPDELADAFGGSGNNNIERLNNAIDALQLPCKTGLNIHETVRELEKGKVAIALMNQKSIFASGQHFIVFSGVNEAGRIVVLDPCGPDYEKWNLKNALVNGFKSSDLSGSFGGSWVFDKSEMPEEPFIYAKAAYDGEKRYDFDLTEEERTLLAKLLYMEVRGESAEGQQAAAEVVLNRVAADNFQSTVKGVVMAEGQFRSANRLYEAKPTQIQYDAVDRALNGPYILPEDVVFFSTGAVNKNVWGTIGSHVFCYQW